MSDVELAVKYFEHFSENEEYIVLWSDGIIFMDEGIEGVESSVRLSLAPGVARSFAYALLTYARDAEEKEH